MHPYKAYDFDILLDILNSLRPFDKHTAQSIQDNFFLRYNQQSNAIEGNSLTLSETKVLLENGLTAKGKPFKDHVAILNHKHANDYLQETISAKYELSEKIIKEFNYLLLKGTENERQAGVYRQVPVMIQGSEHVPPQPYLLQSKMENLIAHYSQHIAHCNKNEKIDYIAKLHADFVHIHPFIDGNGRTGRLLMNFELLKHHYPLAIISTDNRVDYYEALSQADKGNYDDITTFIKDTVKASIIDMLRVVCPDWESIYQKRVDERKG